MRIGGTEPRTAAADDPAFARVEPEAALTAGLIYAANVRFFFPLGLALTLEYDAEHRAIGVQVREWVWPDGHVEAIAVDPADELLPVRRAAFVEYARDRLVRMSPEEREAALAALNRRAT